MKINVECKHCGSDDIRSYDSIIATCDVSSWSRDDSGELVPEFCGESDVFWDTQSPVHEDRPYQCGDCGELLAASDLVVTEIEDDAEEA